ncbi:sensor histidine kinase [Ancylobacter sp. TS-1]|uniref:sensor histidine kinase n=1 Tax=Ancylobacter sp. TS-1 TaxID=1850374 RepID=UPI001265D519|nr:histidine kinase [Ancylobacter sp. TS-1]QFR33859.1 sensor histidine kinase [Ancylobacter sp. TS-1]
MNGTQKSTKPPRLRFGLSPFLRIQIIGWALFALIDLVNRQLAYLDIAAAVALTAIVYPTMIVLSVALRRIYDRHFASTVLSLPTLFAMALLASAGAAVVVGMLTGARATFGWSIPNWRPLEEIALPFFHYAICLFGWSLLYFWIRADRLRRMEHEAAIAAQADALRAEIQQLRLQINPHFLFNALNGIAEEVPEHPATALEMLRDLTDYLRHVLAGIRTPVVTVEAEVEALTAYLRIQQARFGARLRTRVEMDPAAAGRRIANSLLQPLVENAVEHGDRSEVLDVVLRIDLAGDGLRIAVENSGSLTPRHRKRASHGLGLANLRRRLDVHYPHRHVFSLDASGCADEAADGGGVRVAATLLLEGEPCSAS